MTYVDFMWNSESEGGAGKVRVDVPRVPAENERVEFWNPDGSAANVHPELDGNVFFVAEVNWVTYRTNRPYAADCVAKVFLIPKSQLQSEEQADS